MILKNRYPTHVVIKISNMNLASIGGTKIKRETLMSVKDFYNAVTPGSSLSHGVGRGVYTIVDKNEICSQKMFDEEKLPIQRRKDISVLNEVILMTMKLITLHGMSN